MKGIDALVVWTPGDEDPTEALESLLPQVDTLVVVANGGRPETVPEGVRFVDNERPLGIGANINKGIAATSAPFVITANPDTVATPGSIETLRAFAESHPRCASGSSPRSASAPTTSSTSSRPSRRRPTGS